MSNKRYVFSIIIWGSMWGIAESTIGYFLHNLPINIGYLVWFPMAYFFMSGVFRATGKCQSILHISILAALIKTVNLLMPIRIDRVINPIVSILLEGLIVFTVYAYLNRNNNQNFLYLKTLYASIGWRILYLIYLFFVPQWMYIISPLAEYSKLINFVIYESLLNSFIIYFIIRLSQLVKPIKFNYIITSNKQMTLAIILLTANIAVTVLL